MTVVKSVILFSLLLFCDCIVIKRALQKSHEKPRWQKWMDVFLGKHYFDQVQSLVQLLTKLSLEHLSDCTPIILYDVYTELYDNLLLQKLLRNYPLSYIHGQITENYTIRVENVIENQKTCISYILFIKDVMRCRDVIGAQTNNKVVIVARSTQWRVFEFLANELSQSFTNLLVIAKSEKIVTPEEELPYILYTHKLYTDALGSNKPQILTSWFRGNLTRPQVPLFPRKMATGLAGHRFIIYFANQPPFVIKRERDINGDITFDGTEIRLVKLLAKLYNFTTDFREATEDIKLGASTAVSKIVMSNKANLGLAGVYTVEERKDYMGQWHSQDCAAFVSLTSIALPRYRAIMGPFHWTVWLIVTFIYMFAIIPLSFSDQHTLRPLLEKPGEIENMFWYVFGTFTNSFSFVGRGSWTKTDKLTTRLLIGFYWLFTIIITACYTGSIIAFVTLPVYPAVVDTVQQLLSGRFQIGTLDKGGWQYWFQNSSDPATERLLRNIEYIPTVDSGLKNTTKAFFWPYAFLGSKAQLDFIMKTNFTATSKRALLHISKECFVPFNVGFIYPKNSIYKEIFDRGILMAIEYGFMKKIKSDVEWLTMKSSTGKFLAANSQSGTLKSLTVEDRALTLDDTQGMFLLLGAGFLMGAASLISECLGGCLNFCKRKRPSSSSSIESNPRFHERQTPREKLNSIAGTSSVLCNHLLPNVLENESHVTSSTNNDDNQSDDSEVIDKIFENIFGEEFVEEGLTKQEEIDDIQNSY